MCKCCLCNHKFQLTAEARKTVSAGEGFSAVSVLIGAIIRYFDAWDCPSCGAENRLNERYRDDRNDKKKEENN